MLYMNSFSYFYTQHSVIAPFWSDIDLRYSDGKIYLGRISRLSAAESVSSKDAQVYEAVRQLVLFGYGDASFLPTQVVTVTWQDVPPRRGYYYYYYYYYNYMYYYYPFYYYYLQVRGFDAVFS